MAVRALVPMPRGKANNFDDLKRLGLNDSQPLFERPHKQFDFLLDLICNSQTLPALLGLYKDIRDLSLVLTM